MALPAFSMRQLLEAGVHFGHNTRRWNPKMAPFIFGVRNDVHIIDLQQTVPLLHQAMNTVRSVAAAGGRVLFVGTKRQASRHIAEAASRCGQYYVDHRWLGGMLTNWKTMSNSIRRLKELDGKLTGDSEEKAQLTKKELLKLTRERDKLERALGGIKDMGAPPDIVVIIDTNKESIAVLEARKLKIPVVAVVDSNSDPDGIDFPIPGNDDSLRAIELYCELVSAAVLDGLQEEARTSGVDVGESEDVPAEMLPAGNGVEAGAAEAAPADDAKAEAKPEAEAKADAKPAAKEKAKTEAKPKADAKAKPETKPKADAKAKADAKPKADAKKAEKPAKAAPAKKADAKADKAKADKAKDDKPAEAKKAKTAKAEDAKA